MRTDLICSVCSYKIGKTWALVQMCMWLTPPKEEVICAKCHNVFWPILSSGKP